MKVGKNKISVGIISKVVLNFNNLPSFIWTGTVSTPFNCKLKNKTINYNTKNKINNYLHNYWVLKQEKWVLEEYWDTVVVTLQDNKLTKFYIMQVKNNNDNKRRSIRSITIISLLGICEDQYEQD